MTLSAFSPYTGVYAEEPAENEEIIEEENPSYEETDYAAAIAQSGLFYLDEGTNQIDEGSSALFRIARSGENLPEAHVKLSLIDISARYGEDYEIRVLAQTDVIPQVPQEMTSILEEIENSDEAVEEIYAEDTEVAPQQLTEEDAQAFGDLIGEQLSQYAAKHPDEYVVAATDAASVKETGRSALSEAFSQATGLEDDALPMSSDGSAVLDVNALMAGYTVDTIDELSTAFSSAYVWKETGLSQTRREKPGCVYMLHHTAAIR